MFQNLPVELLQYIFMLLSPCTDFPNISQVCRRWRDVCLEVIKIRSNMCLAAYRLQAPLKWCTLSSACQPMKGSSVHSAPSKRFGSMLVNNGKALYVFGGATHMRTTFNDLWVFDLAFLQWKRVLGDGILPTPRAYAKGGFIGETLYVFGGCQSFHQPSWHNSGRIECLSDLYSFNPSTLLWSRLPLCHATQATTDPPPVCVGQSGCFLPGGSVDELSLLVLFGGISLSQGTCINDLCIFAPTRGQWLALSEADQTSSDVVLSAWPPGRWGHSVCALDAYRMLVLFGNSESPASPSFEPPIRRQRLPSAERQQQEESMRRYRGDPVADLWILTRCGLQPGEDWSTTTWFWTKVSCSTSVPSCPPIDFEHATILNLPYRDSDADHTYPTFEDFALNGLQAQVREDDASATKVISFTVVCVSQPTEQLLEEAARQRRSWQRQKACTSLFSRPCPPRSPSGLSAVCDNLSSDPSTTKGCNRHGDLFSPSSSGSSPNPEPSVSQADCSSTVNQRMHKPGPRRSADKRAKQLEALAIQERRLFGSRTKPSSDAQTVTNGPDSTSSLTTNDQMFPSNPIALYSLELRVCQRQDPCVPAVGAPHQVFASGRWLPMQQPNYVDLLFAPQECRGYSCTFAHGCVFLFGGLCSSDELYRTNEASAPQQQQQQQLANIGYPLEVPNRLVEPTESSRSLYGQPGGSSVPPTRISQFFILQPRSLVGTII
ncbi:F-box only protein 42 [Clonorchis sinensis]|uniref:F-box only protein 42 n=1 Tax=Clonorchis sinensis TaxID=79923 RepID=A0A8T1M022_CLOSI|nr:F-box only protein 42 [Clonorchis sinensis]